jgi:hypothetical protein
LRARRSWNDGAAEARVCVAEQAGADEDHGGAGQLVGVRRAVVLLQRAAGHDRRRQERWDEDPAWHHFPNGPP